MVAKIPLLMSSRMMSAGLTPSSSASSLTVIVPGSSIAPRSRGSSVCTPPPANAPSRRGGLRGPRRPRVPLLLLATGFSFGGRCCHGDALGQRRTQRFRERCLQRPTQGALRDGSVETLGRPADVCAAARAASRLIGVDAAIGSSDDPQQVSLRTNRATGNAGPIGNAARGDVSRRPVYDATSSVAAL